MLVQHGRLAAEVGVAPENIFIIENGQPIEFLPDGTARRGAPVEAGYVFVDGLSVGEVGDVVLRDRRALANDGMFLVVVTVDKQTGNLVGTPEIVTRGFVADADDAAHRRAPPSASRASIANPGDHISEIGLLKAQIKDGLSQYLYEQTQAPADGLPGRGRGLRLAKASRTHDDASADQRPESEPDAPASASASCPAAAVSLPLSRRTRCARWSASCCWWSAAITADRAVPAREAASSTRSSTTSCGRCFGQGAWLLAVLLLVGRRARRARAQGRQRLGRGRRSAALLVFVGGEGLIHLAVGPGRSGRGRCAQGGGRARQRAVRRR